jgi:hypothetical protein
MAPIYAWFRQGFKELSQLLPAFPNSIRPIEEIGMMGNPTQAMVTQQVKGEETRSVLQGYADRAQGISDQQRQEVRQEQMER